MDVLDSCAAALGARFERDDAANGHDKLEDLSIDDDMGWRHGLSSKNRPNLIRNVIIEPNAARVSVDSHKMILHRFRRSPSLSMARKGEKSMNTGGKT